LTQSLFVVQQIKLPIRTCADQDIYGGVAELCAVGKLRGIKEVLSQAQYVLCIPNAMSFSYDT
ncbi:hypothetical protein, partial [Microvirga sp. G4-2]|uniref:hypothetical protein n=1 Tax=Microvirga sp. G4-2 TaxID=3434467 RepID=UPI004044FB85